MRIPRSWFNSKVEWAKHLAPGPRGARHAPATPIEYAYCEDKIQLVRGAGGAQVVSSAFVIVDPDKLIQPEDLVTLWLGRGAPLERTSRVITTAHFERPGLLNHHVAYLE